MHESVGICKKKACGKPDNLMQMASAISFSNSASNNPSKVKIGRDLDFVKNDEVTFSSTHLKHQR